jgi:hypothetical protein
VRNATSQQFSVSALQDWDILYFNATFTTRGQPVSPHLFAIRWTPSAIGYVATPAFARKVLENARNPWQNAWVDIIFEVRLGQTV